MALDAEAQAAIAAALEACAARAREANRATGEAAVDCEEDDPDAPFVCVPEGGDEYRGSLERPEGSEEWLSFTEGEAPWRLAGAEMPEWAVREEPDEG